MALVRFWRWIGQRPASVAAKQEPHADDNSPGAARARFWAELRAGQREAEARKAASLIGDGVREG